MSVSQAVVMTEPPPENLDAYLGLSRQEIGRLVFCLLMFEDGRLPLDQPPIVIRGSVRFDPTLIERHFARNTGRAGKPKEDWLDTGREFYMIAREEVKSLLAEKNRPKAS